MDAVILGHAKEIHKMFIRESERVVLKIPTTFQLIPAEQLQLDVETDELPEELESHIQLEGNIVDMSSGGLKVETEHIPNAMRIGDTLVFHLQGANLRDNMIGRIARTLSIDGKFNIHLQFINF